MKEVGGNLWDYHKQGNWVVITTNGSVRWNGCAVMRRGVAKEAAGRFTELPHLLGETLREEGNSVHFFLGCRIFTFPVKHKWQEKADLVLIRASTEQLDITAKLLSRYVRGIFPLYMVRPGCGNGGLDWKDVKPIVEYLDDRFIVVERNLQ